MHSRLFGGSRDSVGFSKALKGPATRAKAVRGSVTGQRAIAEAVEGRTLFSTAFALSGTNLLRFDTAFPTNITATTPITGVDSNETIVGIDFRPQNGFLYGLGVNATANTATLYVISTQTGVAGPVSNVGAIALEFNTGVPIDLPSPSTENYGFDFNPSVDRLRITAGSLNFRVNPNTGLPIDGDNGSAPGGYGGVNPDGAISLNLGQATVSNVAYTNNQTNNGNITTLYTIDGATNSLFIQSPPNTGTQTTIGTITLGGNPLDFTIIAGFDIPAGVNAASNNAAVSSGSALAVLQVGLNTSLYSIDLTTQAATLVGKVGDGLSSVRSLAIQPDTLPAIALTADGANLVRFNVGTPGTVVSQPLGVNALATGETLAGIDWRPQTGQLYGLAINPATDNASLYLIDPQGGALTPIGSQGAISFTSDGVSPIDLADPAFAGYGFDFNPTVDRIRVTNSVGLNFRINPNTGAAIDGDNGSASLVTGVNPDGSINGGGSTSAVANAYTNSYTQSLSGGATTLYTLNAASDTLFIQEPPNSGTQSVPLALTLNGNSVDISDVTGFDIPAGVSVGTSSAPATAGYGFFVATVGTTTGLYRVELVSGKLTALGAVGGGSTTLSGLTLGDSTTPVAQPTLSIDDPTKSETNTGQTTLIFTLIRSGGDLTTASTVEYTTADGTADSSDYVSTAGTLTFDPYQISATIPVLVNGDTAFEADETLQIVLSNPSNLLLPDTTGEGTIVNDDSALPAPSYRVADESTLEGDTGTRNLTFTIYRDGDLSAPSSVQFNTEQMTASSSTDYIGRATSTLNFAVGESAKIIRIPVKGDTTREADEKFLFKLFNPSAGSTISDGRAFGAIRNDDPKPKITVADASVTEGQTGTRTLNFTLQLNKECDLEVKVNYATANGTANSSDYEAKSGTVTFAPGQTSRTVSITIKGDKTKEANETFFLNLSSVIEATLSDSQAKGTINNDD